MILLSETIKLLVLDPVTTAATPAELAYMGRFLGEDTRLEGRAISNGPASIECEYDEAMALPQVVALAQASAAEFDGIFIDCFADPGVRAVRECVDVPVCGGFEPVLQLALGLADRIAIITVLPQVIPLLRENVAKAGLGERVYAILSADIPVLSLGDHEALVKSLFAQSRLAITEKGAEAIVLGCTAMIDVAEELEGILKASGLDVPVLEAGQAALMMLELQVKMGLSHSRRTYHLVRS